MYTYEYDPSFFPSMPVVDVHLPNIEEAQATLTLIAMIDSGADGTMIPIAHLRAINARRAGQIVLRSVTGARTLVDIYPVALRVGPHIFAYVRVVADEQNDIVVLGRDLLNHMIVTLNGLASATEIQD